MCLFAFWGDATEASKRLAKKKQNFRFLETRLTAIISTRSLRVAEYFAESLKVTLKVIRNDTLE